MVSALGQQARMRDQVFISYSHKDVVWMEKFSTHLKAIGQTGRLKTWTDHQIEPGQDWYAEIEAAIARASVALLLTSADFLASDFIQKEEIPKLLKKHQNEGLFLYGVPLKHAPYALSSLASIQTAGGLSPEKPLASLEDSEQDRVMSAIALDIGQKLGQSVCMADDARQRLVEQVRQRLRDIGMEIIEEIGCGDTSIVFKAQQGFREYAVKILVNGGLSASERKSLKDLLQTIAKLDDPAYIKIRDALLE